MTKALIAESQELYDKGHTFYAIAHQLKQWYGAPISEKQISTGLGLPNNPVGHKKFKGEGHA